MIEFKFFLFAIKQIKLLGDQSNTNQSLSLYKASQLPVFTLSFHQLFPYLVVKIIDSYIFFKHARKLISYVKTIWLMWQTEINIQQKLNEYSPQPKASMKILKIIFTRNISIMHSSFLKSDFITLQKLKIDFDFIILALQKFSFKINIFFCLFVLILFSL